MLLTANIFQPLIDVFESVLKFFHDTIGVPWGLSIVLLTVLIRALLVPLTLKQFHSMRRLQTLQPQMKEIQNKYKDDKQRQQQELMKFYKENEVNPLGSCLPLVAQLPVFISLFYMLRKSLRNDICPHVQALYQQKFAALHHVSLHAAAGQTTHCGAGHGASFLFISDLTNKATGATLIVLIAVYVCTQLGASLLMSAPTMDKNQRYLMLAMPLLFIFFFIQYPAGLLVYWITTNLWTILQQYIVKQRLGPALPVPAVAGAAGAAAVRGGTGNGRGGGGAARKTTPASAKEESNGAASAGASAGGLGGALRARLKPSEEAGTVTTERPRAGAPPPPPRKKKKRSGRRR